MRDPIRAASRACRIDSASELTRADVLDLLAAEASREKILADYPYLEADDVTAVLEFAAKQNDHPVMRSA